MRSRESRLSGKHDLLSAVNRQRGIRSDEAFLAQVAPEIARDRRLERGMVLPDAIRLARTGDDRSNSWMCERELQRGRLDGNAVALGKRLDPGNLGDDLRRRVRIFEVAASGEDP